MTTVHDEATVEAAISPEPLMQMIQGLQVTGIVQAAVTLGIFDSIAQARRSADETATIVGADVRGTRILLDALVALRLLDLDSGTYRLAPLADVFLVASRPHYLGGMLELMAGPPAWAAYPRLADAVRAGGSVLADHGDHPAHRYWATFANASVVVARPAASALANLLGPWVTDGHRIDVLDIACGSGLYSLTLASAHPHVHTTLLDWANVLPYARRNAEELGVHDRTTYVEGDVFAADLGGPYDVIIASHILHQFSDERCATLLSRLADAAKPGGRLVVHDFMPASDQPAAEPFHALFSVLMLTWSGAGEAHPLDTYQRLVANAGFGAMETHRGVGVPSTFLIAERGAR